MPLVMWHSLHTVSMSPSQLFLLLSALLGPMWAIILEPGIKLHVATQVTDWTFIDTSGLTFAFSRATHGESYVDPTFALNWLHFRKWGLVCGAYHFYDTSVSAHRNFENVEANLFGLVDFGPKDLFAVAFYSNPTRVSSDSLADALRTFLWLVEEQYHTRPLIYTTTAFWEQQVKPSTNDYDFGSYPLWVYDPEPALSPNISSTWKDFSVWQTTNHGHIEGIDTDVELLWRKILR